MYRMIKKGLALMICLVFCINLSGVSDGSADLVVPNETILEYWSSYDYDSFAESYGIVWERDAESGKYTYPITYTSDIWLEFSHLDMIAACHIPDYVLADISETELVELVLTYPLRGDIYAYDTFSMGVSIVSAYFPELEIVLESGQLENYATGLMGEEAAVSHSTLLNAIGEAPSDYDEFTAWFIEDCLLFLANPVEEEVSVDPNSIVYVYTPRGTPVVCKSEPGTLTKEQQDKCLEQEAEYPGAEIVGEWTWNYNCHSYAWYSTSTSNMVWMGDPSAYWLDGSYRELSGVIWPTANGQKIYYTVNLHSAVVVDAANGMVVSKWGEGHLMRHRFDQCSYFTTRGNVHVYTLN